MIKTITNFFILSFIFALTTNPIYAKKTTKPKDNKSYAISYSCFQKANPKINDLDRLEYSISEGYKNYLIYTGRSNKKLIPIHKCLSQIILAKLNNDKTQDFSIKSYGMDDGKEYKFAGLYNTKAIDLTVFYKNKAISGIGVKFVTSNYKQNSGNYFENMLGETINVKAKSLLYGQFLLFKHKIPYWSKKEKTFKKIEQLNDKNLKKYVLLDAANTKQNYKPDFLFIGFVETGDEEDFAKITQAYKNKKPITINKNNFHQKLADKVAVKFIKTTDANAYNYNLDTITFLKKANDFNRFIANFVKQTKAKAYNKKF
ncbi:MAG: hypothetical protein DRQ51_00660 [Gammaproteobacteria bacterium]|nr:MAG: hypothetical protein DRQ51_00660 [Gammaproteobacteria bacterium]